MSTIPEVMTAHHCGIRVLAFSVITNMCVPHKECEENNLGHEVICKAKERQDDLKELVSNIVLTIQSSQFLQEKYL